jgi:transposase
MAELERAARLHPDAHVRSRALAVRAVALGHTRREVAGMLPYSAYTIGLWVTRFEALGLSAFAVGKGRGRPSQVDDQEVLACLRLSPELYGLDQSRWTLGALGRACPSLAGMSDQGILKVLHRLGFHYKRGQPWVHSPDPEYDEKKTPSNGPMPKPGKTPRR